MEGDGAGPERLLTPRFHALLNVLLHERMPEGPRRLAEYAKGGFGRPDLAFARAGQPARAFIELEQPATRLDRRSLRGHDAGQYDRFAGLPLWALSNFHAIRLLRRAGTVGEAVILPPACLDPATADAAAERALRRHDPGDFLRILEALALAMPVAPNTPEQAAEALAHAARLVRDVVLAQCRAGAPAVLALVQDEFRDTLFAHAAAGGFDESDENALFAAAFAQTLAFGLLLAREASALRSDRMRHGAQDEILLPQEVTRDAYRLLPDASYPLLRATLRALTQDEILDVLGVAFDVIRDTVNAIDIGLLAPRDGSDPILYFYEFFLATFDPAARRRHGVFFTPVPVVRFMVALTDRAVRTHLSPQGLLDRDLRLLDPACGTRTFLIAAAEAVAVFDAVVALLSAASYTRRFAWDLEETFAHVPFPGDAATFADAVRIGAEIRALETFARDPAAAFRSARIRGHASGAVLSVPPIGQAFRADGAGRGSVALQEDQSLLLVPVPQPVWEFAVSGYRALARPLTARHSASALPTGRHPA